MPIWIHKAGSPTTVKFSSPQEIVINHADDSIRLGDGTTLSTGTSNGGKFGIDVNDISGAKLPIILNITTGIAGTESSHTFPSNTKKFKIKARGTTRLQYAFVTGETNVNYVTIPFGGELVENDLYLTSPLTIYLEADKNSQIVEIIYWT